MQDFHGRPLPDAEDFMPYISATDWAAGLTAQTMQRIVALRRNGASWSTINFGWLNLPMRRLLEAYNAIPDELR